MKQTSNDASPMSIAVFCQSSYIAQMLFVAAQFLGNVI
jgi:hypothetical protein